MDSDVSDLFGHGGVLNDEVPFVQSGSLLFRDIHTDLRDGESSLLILIALLGLWGFGAGPFGLFLVTVKFAFNLDVQGHQSAVLTNLEFGVDLNSQVLGQESLTAESNNVTAGLLGSIQGCLEFQTSLGLLLTVARVNNGLTDGFNGLRSLGKSSGSFVDGLTNGCTDEQFSLWVLDDLEQVLDGVLTSLLEWLLDGVLQLIEGGQWSLLTQKSKDESVTTCAFSKSLNGSALRFGG